MGSITSNPDHTVLLNLSGIVLTNYAAYYDLFPLDASVNLVDWSRLATVERTNASPVTLQYLDLQAAGIEKRFYRTPTNRFITPLPKPSGPFTVGTVSRLMTDPSRTNRYNIRTNSSFMATFWYPAQGRAGAIPGGYVENNTTLYTYLNQRNPSSVSNYVSHALPGLAVATNLSSYPVVIYSHGGGFRRQNTDKAQELASHGYIVIAADHVWANASVFPNGRVVTPEAICTDTKACFLPTVESGVKDYLFLLDELTRLNNNDALFAGRLDLNRVGGFAFSLSCASMAEFCRKDSRCRAVALLDAGPLLEAPPDLFRFGLQKPFLSMNSVADRPPVPAGFNPNWLFAVTNLFGKATNDAYLFQIQSATHQSFQDRGSLINDPSLNANPTPVSRSQSRTIRVCLLSFFDKYIKDEDDHLLDNPAAVYSNVINFQRK